MKKSLLLTTAIASLGVAGFLLVPNLVNAQDGLGNGSKNGGGYERAITTKAQVLGISAEELKTQLQTETMEQVIANSGLTEEQFQQAMQAAAEARWAERGLSAEEIAERQALRAANQASHEDGEGECDGSGSGGNGVRYGQNR